MKESCHTHEWAMSHTWMSHVAHTKEPHNVTHATLLYVQSDSFLCVTLSDSFVCTAWLIHMCDIHPFERVMPHCVTLLYVRRDSFICVCVCVAHSYVWHPYESFICVTFTHVSIHMIHSYMWRSPIHMCDVHPFICVCVYVWLMHMCDIHTTHSYVWHSPTWLIHMRIIHPSEREMPHVWTSHVTHTSESCHVQKRVTSPIKKQSRHPYEQVMSHIWMTHRHSLGLCLRYVACVAVCCSVLQCVAVCCSVSQYVAVCCSVLQCVAVCCSVLQYVTHLDCANSCAAMPAYFFF